MRCYACSETETPLSLDHVMPRSLGGSNHPSNLVAACIVCNTERGNRRLSIWRPDLVSVVRKLTRRKLDRAAARRMAEELYPERVRAARERIAKRRAGFVSSDLMGLPF